MSWLVAIAAVAIAVAIATGLYAAWDQTAFAAEKVDQFRKLNTALVRERFGPEEALSATSGHKVLSSEEQRIVSEGVLLGLRQTLLVEDDSGSHWRVVVANAKGVAPFFEAQRIGSLRAESHDDLGTAP